MPSLCSHFNFYLAIFNLLWAQREQKSYSEELNDRRGHHNWRNLIHWMTRMLHFSQVHWTQILVDLMVLNLIAWPLFSNEQINEIETPLCWFPIMLMKTTIGKPAWRDMLSSEVEMPQRHPPPYLYLLLNHQWTHWPGSFSTKKKQKSLQNESGGEASVVANGLTRLHPQPGGVLEWEQSDAEHPGWCQLPQAPNRHRHP